MSSANVDGAAFRTMVEPHLPGLRAHSYRMLGSLAEADDVVQQSMLRAWEKLATFEGRSSFRTWLYRIATHACLDALEARPMRGPEALDPCPRAYWEIESDTVPPDATIGAKESVALAFIAAVQRVPPMQRAALLLTEVVGMSAAEVAELLDTTTQTVNSSLQRARATLAERPVRADHVRPSTDPSIMALVKRYVQAWEARDAKALVTLLRDDAVLTMPPATLAFFGRKAIAKFLEGFVPTLGEMRVRPIEVSGGVGLAGWVRAPGATTFHAYAIQALELEPAGIAGVHAHLKSDLFERFGLPETL